MKSKLCALPLLFILLTSLTPQRPRILIAPDTFDRLTALAATDTLLQRYVSQVVDHADRVVQMALPVYNVADGPMLDVSRDCLDRVLTLSVAYRFTGRQLYADHARRLLLHVCRFRDWNYYHFLDVAEMATAVAIGYDWLHESLGAEALDEIRLALIRNALVPGLAVYGSSPWQYWLTVDHNWNQVCNGGLVVAALAIADTDPVYAEKIIPQAVKNIPYAMASYAPDGAWGEGVSYWFYATRYTVYCLTTMLASLGTDYGLSESPGFDRTGYFPIMMTTPAGAWFSYADISMTNGSKPLPVMFWLSQRFGNPHFSQYEHRMLRRYPATALDVVYYPTGAENNCAGRPLHPGNSCAGRPLCGDAVAAPLPLDAEYGGTGRFVTMRQSWDDDGALFLAVSGGDNRINHGHLDKGSFELERYGVKWVRDLGSDNYFLPGYWEKEEGGRRWQYFRMNSMGHAVPVINGRSQRVEADTRFVATNLNVSEPQTTIDLSEAYRDVAAGVKRTFRLVNRRRALIVEDTYEPNSATRDYQWQIITGAEVSGSGRSLTLRQDGHTMRLRLLTPGIAFAVESAEQHEPEAANKGFKKILVRCPAAQGPTHIAVRFD